MMTKGISIVLGRVLSIFLARCRFEIILTSTPLQLLVTKLNVKCNSERQSQTSAVKETNFIQLLVYFFLSNNNNKNQLPLFVTASFKQPSN